MPHRRVRGARHGSGQGIMSALRLPAVPGARRCAERRRGQGTPRSRVGVLAAALSETNASPGRPADKPGRPQHQSGSAVCAPATSQREDDPARDVDSCEEEPYLNMAAGLPPQNTPHHREPASTAPTIAHGQNVPANETRQQL